MKTSLQKHAQIELGITAKQGLKLLKQFGNIRYRCEANLKGYEDCKFELGDFYDFIAWIKQSPSGYQEGWHVSRIQDSGNYSYDNIRYCTHQANLAETAEFYLITDLKQHRQVFSQCGLLTILQKEFGLTNLKSGSGAYKVVNTDRLYLKRFKISTLAA